MPKHQGIPYSDLRIRQSGIALALEKDVEWLNQLYHTEKPTKEWSGFNAMTTRSSGAVAKPASTYLFGPVIDAPPSHPDTVLTSLTYMQSSLKKMGMKYIHLSHDMQLYMVASQIKWNNMERFHDITLRPGVMHVIMSACGAIGKLNKGSGLEVLISASSGGIAGIMSVT